MTESFIMLICYCLILPSPAVLWLIILLRIVVSLDSLEYSLLLTPFSLSGPFLDFRFSSTQRGRSKLLHRGYGYVRTSRNERNWICDKRNYNCRITCILDRERGLFVNGRHNHLPVHRLPRGRGIPQHYMNRASAADNEQRAEYLRKVLSDQLSDNLQQQYLRSYADDSARGDVDPYNYVRALMGERQGEELECGRDAGELTVTRVTGDRRDDESTSLRDTDPSRSEAEDSGMSRDSSNYLSSLISERRADPTEQPSTYLP